MNKQVSPQTTSVLKKVGVGVGITASVTYLCDCLHVFLYLRQYYRSIDEEAKQKVLNLLEDQFKNEEEIISRKEFGEKIHNLKEEYTEKREHNNQTDNTNNKKKDNESSTTTTTTTTTTTNTTINPNTNNEGIHGGVDATITQITGESIIFAGGARAALLQLAHPFVAVGVQNHSNIKEVGAQQRFHRTFLYMFKIAFGTTEEAFLAAETIRRLHDRVKGKMTEKTGIFDKNSIYDASQKHAVEWVGATLTETSVMIYEMLVGRLGEREKDQIAQGNARVLSFFGIDPKETPTTWRDFRIWNEAVWESRTLTVTEASREISHFLFAPPSFLFAPALWLVKWYTCVILPPCLQQGFLGRKITCLDLFFFSLFFGFLRFIYRLLPLSFRLLTPYLAMKKRNGERLGKMGEWAGWLGGALGRFIVALALPKKEKKERVGEDSSEK